MREREREKEKERERESVCVCVRERERERERERSPELNQINCTLPCLQNIKQENTNSIFIR